MDSVAASPREYLVRRPAKNVISPPQNPPTPKKKHPPKKQQCKIVQRTRAPRAAHTKKHHPNTAVYKPWSNYTHGDFPVRYVELPQGVYSVYIYINISIYVQMYLYAHTSTFYTCICTCTCIYILYYIYIVDATHTIYIYIQLCMHIELSCTAFLILFLKKNASNDPSQRATPKF